jgi:hypothetical protein
MIDIIIIQQNTHAILRYKGDSLRTPILFFNLILKLFKICFLEILNILKPYFLICT